MASAEEQPEDQTNWKMSIPNDEKGEPKSPPLSSSSSSSEDGGTLWYDVFLSFQGEDTINDFTGHLYQALKEKGVRTFSMDSHELEKGKNMEEVFGHIEKSRIFLPIFSKGYADSERCLKAIAKMVKCKRTILPVFVGLRPEEICHRHGPFERAFKRYTEDTNNFPEKMVSEWRDALREAGSISGFNLLQTQGHEPTLVRMITEFVLNMLPDMSNIDNLLSFDASFCNCLTRLPDSIGCLTNLEMISLACCYGLEGIPSSIGDLKNLMMLNLEQTAIEEVPYAIGNLTNLKALELTETKIQELPDSVGLLEKLTKLSLRGCKNLECLPVSLTMCTKLEVLDMGGSAIKEIPENIGNLTNLKELNLNGCKDLSGLPSSLQSLSRLEELVLDECACLESLPMLPPSVITVSAADCFSLVHIPGISNCISLQSDTGSSFNVSCQMLPTDGLPNLKHLDLARCDEFKFPPKLPSSLRFLGATYCPPSRIVTYLSNLTSLIYLDLSGCEMHSVSGLENLQCLLGLDAFDCRRLSHITELPPSLTTLRARRCHALEIISDVSNLKSLDILILSNCPKLIDIVGLEKSNSISRVELQGCTSLSISFWERILKELNLEGHVNFTVPGIVWQQNDRSVVSAGLSFVRPNFVIFNRRRTLEVNIEIEDIADDSWKEAQMQTEVVTMDGRTVFQHTTPKLAMLEEEMKRGRCFEKYEIVVGEKAEGNATVIISFDRIFRLKGEMYCVSWREALSSIAITILSGSSSPLCSQPTETEDALV